MSLKDIQLIFVFFLSMFCGVLGITSTEYSLESFQSTICIVRKGQPVHFTFWENIIQTKTMRTTGLEKTSDFFPKPTGRSYFWQSSDWISGWDDSWLEENKLRILQTLFQPCKSHFRCLFSRGSVAILIEETCQGKELMTIKKTLQFAKG